MSEKKPFNIYTAIDILEEKCVRLEKGDYKKATVYNKDPLFVARRWKSQGADYLHVIDLDGAREGRAINRGIIRKMVTELDMKVQVGGGIRNMNTVEAFLDSGCARVIIGSAAIKDQDFVKEALKQFGGDKVMLGLDCMNGNIAVEGWQESSDITALQVVQEFKEHGLKIVELTDIDTDGMLSGPNLEALEAFAKEAGVDVIASGGISEINDVYEVKKLRKKDLPIDGAIIGKALYTGKIKPKELYCDDVYN